MVWKRRARVLCEGTLMWLHAQLPLNSAAPGVARKAAETLARAVSDEVLDRVRLVLSELVTNSVLHSGTREEEGVQVRIELTPLIVRIEVRDRGPGFDQADLPPDPDRIGNWGLLLVQRVTDRWGLEHNNVNAMRTWAEIDLPVGT